MQCIDDQKLTFADRGPATRRVESTTTIPKRRGFALPVAAAVTASVVTTMLVFLAITYPITIVPALIIVVWPLLEAANECWCSHRRSHIGHRCHSRR